MSFFVLQEADFSMGIVPSNQYSQKKRKESSFGMFLFYNQYNEEKQIRKPGRLTMYFLILCSFDLIN